jgi:1,4-alpha-glucan branching enzyme
MVTQQADGTVEFAYFRPSAESVTLAGDFNGWRAQAHPMKRDERGWWRLKLALPTGEYRFKYIVDAKLWEADFAAFGVEMDAKRGWTSVVMIHEKAPANQIPRPLAA